MSRDLRRRCPGDYSPALVVRLTASVAKEDLGRLVYDKLGEKDGDSAVAWDELEEADRRVYSAAADAVCLQVFEWCRQLSERMGAARREAGDGEEG